MGQSSSSSPPTRTLSRRRTAPEARVLEQTPRVVRPGHDSGFANVKKKNPTTPRKRIGADPPGALSSVETCAPIAPSPLAIIATPRVSASPSTPRSYVENLCRASIDNLSLSENKTGASALNSRRLQLDIEHNQCDTAREEAKTEAGSSSCPAKTTTDGVQLSSHPNLVLLPEDPFKFAQRMPTKRNPEPSANSPRKRTRLTINRKNGLSNGTSSQIPAQSEFRSPEPTGPSEKNQNLGTHTSNPSSAWGVSKNKVVTTAHSATGVQTKKSSSNIILSKVQDVTQVSPSQNGFPASHHAQRHGERNVAPSVVAHGESKNASLYKPRSIDAESSGRLPSSMNTAKKNGLELLVNSITATKETLYQGVKGPVGEVDTTNKLRENQPGSDGVSKISEPEAGTATHLHIYQGADRKCNNRQNENSKQNAVQAKKTRWDGENRTQIDSNVSQEVGAREVFSLNTKSVTMTPLAEPDSDDRREKEPTSDRVALVSMESSTGDSSLPEINPDTSRKASRNTHIDLTAEIFSSADGDEFGCDDWVQCEKCDKWRRLPPFMRGSDLPEGEWDCSLMHWNQASASCSTPQEAYDMENDVENDNDEVEDISSKPAAKSFENEVESTAKPQITDERQERVQLKPEIGSKKTAWQKPERKEAMAKVSQHRKACPKDIQIQFRVYDVQTGAVARTISDKSEMNRVVSAVLEVFEAEEQVNTVRPAIDPVSEKRAQPPPVAVETTAEKKKKAGPAKKARVERIAKHKRLRPRRHTKARESESDAMRPDPVPSEFTSMGRPTSRSRLSRQSGDTQFVALPYRYRGMDWDALDGCWKPQKRGL